MIKLTNKRYKKKNKMDQSNYNLLKVICKFIFYYIVLYRKKNEVSKYDSVK